MQQTIGSARELHGELKPPGDKSISHRALIFNSLAKGMAEVSNLAPGLDCRSTIDCLRSLGSAITTTSEGTVSISGGGLNGFSEPETVLDAGNSGTTMRLLSGLLAGQPFLSIINGDESLRRRPMDRIVEPLQMMGANIWGRNGNSLAPLAIKGGFLKGVDYSLPVASAQVKTALLLAGLFAKGETILTEPGPSRDHSERMLGAMGAALGIEKVQGHISLRPPTRDLSAIDVAVPGDISSAAYFIVAGVVHPSAEIRLLGVGVNPTRSGIIDVLLEMGADLSLLNERNVGGEPVADVVVRSSRLRGVDIGGEIIPRLIDEIPVLAVAASCAEGKTTIRDAGELRVKESDRISATATELIRLGARIQEQPDGMVIQGGIQLKGTSCNSHGDHRLAMTLAIAGLVAKGHTIIQGAEAVDVSYPTFWQDLKQIGGDPTP